MAAPGDKWIFNRSQLSNTPSRKCGIDPDKELNYRQQTANFIQDMGQRLQVTQLCINTAIVYMHRFYMFHSFAKFNRHQLAAACLFLAAKVEEQPRKLEHVIKVAHMCQHKEAGLDTKSEAYLEQAQELVVNENILLQSLGFDITVDHPHTHVVKTCQLVRAAKDLAQTSYFLATNSLHLTSMCLQYHPTVVASVCIHLACKWSNWQIPRSSEGKEWFWYTDKTVTHEMLEELTREFLDILDKCPSKLKKKIMTWKSGKERDREELTYEPGKKQFQGYSLSKPSSSSTSSSASKAAASSSSTSRPLGHDRSDIKIPPKDVKLPTKDIKVPPSDIKPVPAAAAVARTSAGLDMTDPGMRRVKTEPSLQNATHPHTLTPREYMERKERDRLAAQAAAKTQVAGQNRAGEQRGADRHHLDALIAGHERNRPDSHREQGLHSGVKAEHGQAEHRHNRHAEHRHSRHGDPSRQYAEHAHHRDKMRDPNMPQRSHMDPHQQRPHASAAPNKEGSSRPQQGTVHRSHTDIMKIRDPISQSVQNIAQKQEGQLRMHGDPSHSKSLHRTHGNLKSQTPHKPLELKSPTKPPDIKSPEIKTPPGLKSDKKLFLETMVKIEPLPPPEQLMAELSKPLKAEPESPTGTKLTMSLSALQNRYEVTRTPEKKPQSPLKRQSSEKPGPEQHAPIRVKLGDLKREKTRHSSTGTPPSEKKDLPKLKISFGGSPGVASVKREDASTSRSSPQSTGELKLKLDLKKSKSHESSPSKSRSTGVDEYKVTNPGNPPLKLKLNLSKMGMSPSTSSHKSSKHSSHHHHHHHHSSKNGSSHSSRKRPHSPQILSPQQQQQQQSSTSNPSKVARTHEHHQRLQQWNNAQTVAANGGNANMMRPEYGRTQSQEDISEAQLQLQQLIALQSAKMQQQFGDLLPTTNQQE